MRNRYTFRQDSLNTAGYKGFVTRGITLTVLSDTKKKYTSAFRRFVVFLIREKRPMTLDSFEAFLHACRAQGAKGPTLEESAFYMIEDVGPSFEEVGHHHQPEVHRASARRPRRNPREAHCTCGTGSSTHPRPSPHPARPRCVRFRGIRSIGTCLC